ncbi:MAG: hypothetical protein WC606_00910 [Candidatus Absconditabacterales bacterium]|jgi:hypothetical protein
MKNLSTSKIIGIVAIILVMITGMQSCSFYRGCVQKENSIVASDEKLAAVISSKDNILDGQSQVVKQYSQTVIKAIDAVMSGRYGDGGSKAVMQWIQEKNPEISSTVYIKLQQSVETWFTNIQMANEDEIAKVANYKNHYQDPVNIVFAWAFGFPKIDMKKYGKPIITKNAKKEQDTRESTPVNLNL